MSFEENIAKPQSPKNTLVEIDVPLNQFWQNLEAGIWFQWLTDAGASEVDDDGNTATWREIANYTYYNVGSINVGGELLTEVTSLVDLRTTNKSWFYDTDTTYIYIHKDEFDPPESHPINAVGIVVGYSLQINKASDNYYEDIYYEPLITNVFNFVKKKDALFFGLIQFQGGNISFDNIAGKFDDFAERDLYGQPVRIFFTFEGLDYSEAELVYTGRVGNFKYDNTKFNLQVVDKRKYLSRKLPVNKLTSADYPSLDSKLDGTPIPIAFGSVVKAPTYKTDTGEWKFCDTEFNAVDSGIVVYNDDDTIFSHGGTETDGTFTGADTDEKLTVSFSQGSVINGLDIISDILGNYESVTYNDFNYDTIEWEYEKNNVTSDEGIWIGKGKLKTTIDIAEQICTNNQGIFDVLADGKYTFRTLDRGKIPVIEFDSNDLLDDSVKIYNVSEIVSSVKIGYSEDLKEKEFELYTDESQEQEVFARYRNKKEQEFETTLTTLEAVKALGDRVMEESKFVYPILQINTKTQYLGIRLLDNILYTDVRQDGKVIIPRSRYQVLEVRQNLSSYELGFTIRQIEEDDTDYIPPIISGLPETYSSGIMSSSVYGGN